MSIHNPETNPLQLRVGDRVHLTRNASEPVTVTAIGERFFLYRIARGGEGMAHLAHPEIRRWNLSDEFPIGAIYAPGNPESLQERSWVVIGHEHRQVRFQFLNAVTQSKNTPLWEPERIRLELREVYRP